MNIKVTLYNSTTNDLAIVIDLLRASTTITVALDTFDKVIPVNNVEKAQALKTDDNVILAGEENIHQIEGFDITNSPDLVREYKGDLLVLKTTNGTKVLESIKKRDENIKVLVGAGINAKAIAQKALELATDEIELVMAGRHAEFNMEDAIGAGLIIEEIINIAKENDIQLDIKESALAAKLLAQDHQKARELIENSWGGRRLKQKDAQKDVEICQLISSSDNVAIYENGELINLNKK